MLTKIMLREFIPTILSSSVIPLARRGTGPLCAESSSGPWMVSEEAITFAARVLLRGPKSISRYLAVEALKRLHTFLDLCRATANFTFWTCLV